MRVALLPVLVGLLAAGAAVAQVKTSITPPAQSTVSIGTASSAERRDLSSALARIARLQAENDALRIQLRDVVGKGGRSGVGAKTHTYEGGTDANISMREHDCPG